MAAFKRVFYTSEVVTDRKTEVSRILDESVRNNAVQGITGVLLQYDGKYLQVIEGDERDVDALLSKLRQDPRHKRMKIRFTEHSDARLFDDWAMVYPSLNDEQTGLMLRLLTSDLPTSQEVGLTFLKYWLTAKEVERCGDLVKTPLRVGGLTDVLQEVYRAKGLSVFLFCTAILLAVLVDAGFFLSEYIDGAVGSLRMLHSYALTVPGLLMAIWCAYKGDASKSVKYFQATALITVGMQALWAGYGIYAPSLPYLGVAIVSGLLSNNRKNSGQLGLLSMLLIGVTVILSLSSATAPYFTQTISPHHAALVGLLFPVICGLLLDAHHRDREVSERFTAGVLADLTDTITVLKRTMTARNYFFAAISHEIRTPMNGAMSAVNLIEHPRATPEIKARSTNALRQSLSNLNRLLNDLLDISKLESGKFELDSAPFDINAATRDVVEFFTPAVEQGGNSITMNLLPAPLVLKGDKQRFEQMLSNFLGNAIKFTKSGRIAVNLRLLAHAQAGDESLWRCEVVDSGIGIAPEESKKLFQPFTQASQNGFSDTKGTGLGLAIVAALAKQMHGDVGVESVEGKGSTFWFTFGMAIHESERASAIAA